MASVYNNRYYGSFRAFIVPHESQYYLKLGTIINPLRIGA